MVSQVVQTEEEDQQGSERPGDLQGEERALLTVDPKEKRSTYTSYAEMMSSILTEIGPRNGQVSTMCAIAYLSTSRGVPRKRAQNK